MLLSLVACGPGDPPPNVLLVTFDTTRYDRLGCTGDPEARTPTVDALAARGLLFERAYASVGLTLPSHTTMMTGLEPLSHGVHNNGRFRVGDETVTLAERLGAAGYRTGAFVSAFVLNRRYNLDQGFEAYGDETHRESDRLGFGVPQRDGEEVTDDALAWLEGGDAERPFFLWVHYYDPHHPLEVPEPFDAIRDLYAAEIAYADSQLARVLEAVERASPERDTLVVFTADHGEGHGEHGERTHGILAYDSTLHVPLILSGPGVPHGARSRAYVRHADIVPTVLEATGLPVPDTLPGRSLLRAHSGSENGEVSGYFESRGPHFDHGWAAIEGVRTERWKYTATPEPPELYDVIADPREQNDVAERETEVVARMETLLVSLRSSSPRPEQESGPLTLQPDEMERLAALGYIEAGGRYAPGEEPDPRPLAAVFSWVDGARGVASRGGYAQAIEVLETLAESPSVRPLVLRTLAPVYAESGDYDQAVAAYEDYIEITDAQEAHLGLARVHLDAGRPESALEALTPLPSTSRRVGILRARALARIGRHGAARESIDRVYEGGRDASPRLRALAAMIIDVAPVPDGESTLRHAVASAPEDPTLKSQLGYYLAVWGGPEDGDEAIRLLEAAAEADPKDADIFANLGWGSYRRARYAEAVSALEKALEIDGGRHLERVRLALALRELGERERARRLLLVAVTARPGAPWASDARQQLEELEREAGDPPEPVREAGDDDEERS
jgi:arylsulfatase A-like enzyme/tetratricopeptide (TPR) repeat protein